MSFFDRIQNNVFQIATNVFGDNCTWAPSAGGDTQAAKVLYKEPTGKYELGQSDFEIEKCVVEYKAGDFPGLFESVAAGGDEKITVLFADGAEAPFWVKQCTKDFDGKTIKAQLTPA